MLVDVCAQKYSKTGTHTRSILEKFAFDTTLSLTVLAAGGGEEIIRLQGYPTFMKKRPIFHPQ